MRTLFERGLDAARAATGERVALADVAPARADRAEEVLPHRRQLPRARGGVEERRLVARDRAVDRVLPERRRDHRPRRADHLPRAPDRGARLRARAGGDHRQGGHATSTPQEAADYIAGYTIFNDITARDIQRREMRSGVFSFCKAIDTLLPARPVDRHPRRGRRPARPARCSLRVNGELRQESHSGNMSVTIPQIIAHYSALGYSRRRHALDRHRRPASPASARTPPSCTCAPAT